MTQLFLQAIQAQKKAAELGKARVRGRRESLPPDVVEPQKQKPKQNVRADTVALTLELQAKGLTRAVIAEKLSVPRSTVSNITQRYRRKNGQIFRIARKHGS